MSVNAQLSFHKVCPAKISVLPHLLNILLRLSKLLLLDRIMEMIGDFIFLNVPWTPAIIKQRLIVANE